MTERVLYVFSEMGIIIGLNGNLRKVMPIGYLSVVSIQIPTSAQHSDIYQCLAFRYLLVFSIQISTSVQHLDMYQCLAFRYPPVLGVQPSKVFNFPFLPNLISHDRLVNIFIIVCQKHYRSMTFFVESMQFSLISVKYLAVFQAAFIFLGHFQEIAGSVEYIQR